MKKPKFPPLKTDVPFEEAIRRALLVKPEKKVKAVKKGEKKDEKL